jgi:hypothetical protein
MGKVNRQAMTAHCNQSNPITITLYENYNLTEVGSKFENIVKFSKCTTGMETKYIYGTVCIVQLVGAAVTFYSLFRPGRPENSWFVNVINLLRCVLYSPQLIISVQNDS